MTLDEMQAKLEEERGLAGGADMPVRLVVKEGQLGKQYECIDVQVHEGLHGCIVLMLAGGEAADMDWPSSEA
jgi:hypothetical protein